MISFSSISTPRVRLISLTALHGMAARLPCQLWGGLGQDLPALDFADLTSTVAQYALQNLCGYLAAAGRLDELHALLRDGKAHAHSCP